MYECSGYEPFGMLMLFYTMQSIPTKLLKQLQYCTGQHSATLALSYLPVIGTIQEPFYR